jgi:hypothetical protein
LFYSADKKPRKRNYYPGHLLSGFCIQIAGIFFLLSFSDMILFIYNEVKMFPASLSGWFPLTKQSAINNLPPRCSGVLKLLRSFFRYLKAMTNI